MKTSELLRKLADVIDSAEAGEQQVQPNKAELTPVTLDTKDTTKAVSMLSPLQQDLEIQKKNAGINNAFDHQHFDQDSDAQTDELEVLKKSAGIPVASITRIN